MALVLEPNAVALSAVAKAAKPSATVDLPVAWAPAPTAVAGKAAGATSGAVASLL